MKELFRVRLLKALRDMGVPEHGQGVWLSKAMKVTPKAAGKWINGDSLPDQSKWGDLANNLGKSKSYFYQDRVEESPVSYQIGGFNGVGGNSNKLIRTIPLISWVTAGAWDDPIDNHSVGDAEAWLPCPLECRPEATFALRVMGESMDSGAVDGYRDGEIIFVDGSQVEPKHNADVIVKNGDGKVTFKRLIYSGDVWYLKPLNPNWPEKIIELDKHATLVGRVMFSGQSR